MDMHANVWGYIGGHVQKHMYICEVLLCVCTQLITRCCQNSLS